MTSPIESPLVMISDMRVPLYVGSSPLSSHIVDMIDVGVRTFPAFMATYTMLEFNVATSTTTLWSKGNSGILGSGLSVITYTYHQSRCC